MITELPHKVEVLLDGPNMAYVATIDAAGLPHVQPVLIGREGPLLVFNTQEGRLWSRRLRRTGVLAVAVANATDPQEYVEIRGHVVNDTTAGAKENIDALARVYLGTDYPNHVDGEVRVVFRVEPDVVHYAHVGTGAHLTLRAEPIRAS